MKKKKKKNDDVYNINNKCHFELENIKYYIIKEIQANW